MLCPRCSHDRKPEHRKDKCLSVDKSSGLFNCHNCGWSGTAANHPEDTYLAVKREKRVYSRPEPKMDALSGKRQEFFTNRGISNATLLKMKVTEGRQWIPAYEQEVDVICFNYYRDGELVNVKYRARGKKFGLAKDCELILYNLDCLKEGPKKAVLIVEGEMDALTMVECGFDKVLSVPNGASKGSMKLEYLDNCIDDLADVTSFIIATDGDEAGEALQQELIRRLGKVRCMVPTYPEGCKDANEILMTLGKHGVYDFVNSSKPVPLDGVLTVEDVADDTDRMYRNGYPKTLELGWSLDDLLRWRTGEFTVVTGIPNHGKSTWLSNVLVRLADLHDWVIAIYSPEKNPVSFLISELAGIYVGKPFYKADPHEKMSQEEYDNAKAFISSHFLFINTDDELTLDRFLKIGDDLVVRYGINAIVGDPWNYFEHDRVAFQSETEYTGIQLGKISKWCKRVDVHGFFVAHPTKMDRDRKTNEFTVPTLYNISGSAHWNNKVDNGITVYRDYTNGTTRVYVQKVRWFFVGRTGNKKMVFDPKGQRFSDFIEITPEQETYEEKKANQRLAERGREMSKSKPQPATLEFNTNNNNDDLPF